MTITDPSEYRVFQRNTSNVASMTITGTYRNGTPTTIEARWSGGAWTVIDAAPAGGTFSGTLTNQSAGQGTLEVRFSNDTSQSGSVANVGVGDVFLCAGQSNMTGTGTNNQVYSHASLKAGLFGNDYIWKNLADPYDSVGIGQVDTISTDTYSPMGSFIPLLATLLMRTNGVPVAFVPCALSGTSIAQWQPGVNHQDRTTLYGSMVYRGLQTGCKAVLWLQGESDVYNGMTQGTYNSNLDALANAIHSDLGVKIVPAKLHALSGHDNSAVNAAIAEAWGDNSNVVGEVDLSAVHSDGLHFSLDADLQTVAEKFAGVLVGL